MRTVLLSLLQLLWLPVTARRDSFVENAAGFELMDDAAPKIHTCCGKDGDSRCAKLPEPCDCTPYCVPTGDQPLQYSKVLPNVALLGDSIAGIGSGYASNVVALLGSGSVARGGGTLGNAVVSAPRIYPNGSGYCGSSYGVVACIDSALGGVGSRGLAKWDVIHFNWGLHDIDNKYSGLIPSNGSTVYLNNLEAVYHKLKAWLAPNGTLIWRTTTPVPPSYKSRQNADVVTVNALASTLFGPAGKYPDVVLHDLYSQVVARCNHQPLTRGYPTSGDCMDVQSRGVHFSDAGKQLTAILTAASIVPYL